MIPFRNSLRIITNHPSEIIQSQALAPKLQGLASY